MLHNTFSFYQFIINLCSLTTSIPAAHTTTLSSFTIIWTIGVKSVELHQLPLSPQNSISIHF